MKLNPNTTRFNGADYVPSRDNERLCSQMERVFNVMSDGEWHTLWQVSDATGAPESSVSAQLRHLRKPRFGGHMVERRHVAKGLFEYRLIINKESN